MSLTIDQLLHEADNIIEEKSQQSKQASAELPFDDIEKFAAYLDIEADSTEKVAGVKPDVFEMNPLEKAAHAVAMVETLLNLSEFEKLAEFELKAREAGHSDEKINEFLEKQAAFNVHKHITLPGALLAAGAAMGGVAGHKKGKDSGYDRAIADVNEAFKQYETP